MAGSQNACGLILLLGWLGVRGTRCTCEPQFTTRILKWWESSLKSTFLIILHCVSLELRRHWGVILFSSFWGYHIYFWYTGLPSEINCRKNALLHPHQCPIALAFSSGSCASSIEYSFFPASDCGKSEFKDDIKQCTSNTDLSPLLSVQRSLEMKTIVCPCSLFNLWVLNFLVPSIVCTNLTPQSAHSCCLWALQRLYLQPSLLLWRPCMTWRYSSLLAYHKSDSSHSFSCIFLLLHLECKYVPGAQTFLWIPQYHTKGGQNWFCSG